MTFFAAKRDQSSIRRATRRRFLQSALFAGGAGRLMHPGVGCCFIREIGPVRSMGGVIGDQILFGCQRESGKILKRTNRRNINPRLLKLLCPEGILPDDLVQQCA
ncbi:MAG: hypothetical protein IID46_04510 [Planctomycetes bacterium]|nr:hypothetical protein [Planctomycetota bacterium]